MKEGRNNENYLDKNDQPIDFEKKRFQFWLDKVPHEIRRWEFDLWKRYKILNQIGYREHIHLKKYGRAKPFPGYTTEMQQKGWKEFKDSFLLGEERKERLQELIHDAEHDWSDLLLKNGISISKEEIGLVALEGSGFRGPRKADTKFSDVDIKILLRRDDGSRNFEIMPSVNDTSNKHFYHVIGCGLTDSARFFRDDMHWLLYPHYPIFNTLSAEEVSTVIKDLVDSTYLRKEEIEARINSLDQQIENKREETMFL